MAAGPTENPRLEPVKFPSLFPRLKAREMFVEDVKRIRSFISLEALRRAREGERVIALKIFAMSGADLFRPSVI